MNGPSEPEGIYAAYFTGLTGSSFGLILLKDGVIAGADPTGGIFDGHYIEARDGNGWEGTVQFSLPAGQASVLGQPPSSAPMKLDVPIRLPRDFDSGKVIRIETPAGPINARFTQIRSLP